MQVLISKPALNFFWLFNSFPGINLLTKDCMKSYPFIPLICCGFFVLAGCSAKLMPEGHFQTKPVIIDGNISDWGLPLRFSNAEYTMQYSVVNDNRNIMSVFIQRTNLLKNEF